MFRLKSIYIKDYKNIQDQTFDFSSNTGYIALIGLNGSGKSNLLEAISIIFNDLLDIPHTENVNGYSITFQLNDIEYTHTTVDDTEEHNIIPLTAVDTENLPSSIIACYSGEDLRLWHMAFEDYYMQYFRGAIRNRSFSPKIVYINKYCWKIAFISLLCSQKDTVKEFLKNVFSIDDIISVDIHIEADAEKREKFADHAACRWYDRIKELQDEDDHQLINARTLATTDMMIYGAQNADIAPYYVFQYLYLLALPEKNVEKGQAIDKLITDLDISINGVSFDNLSEGEKKLILIETITQILGDENSLVLLDEPDAHVHIENKKAILETITQYNGQTILTTHSAVMCNLVTETKNIMLLNDGKNTDTSKLEQLKKLSGGYINYFNGSLLLNSNNPLVLVEGVGDINYIRKAIDLLSDRYPSYVDISWDMLFMGGAGENAKQFISEIRPNINEQRKVIVIFDRDESGAEAMNKLGYSGNRNDYKTYKNGNWYFMMLPKTAGYTELDFTIEDYFSLEYKKKIAKDKIDESGGFFKKLPKDLRQNVKDALGKNMKEYQANDMANFAILINKIINILNGTDTDIEEK